MIKPKKKICVIGGELAYIFAQGSCKYHHQRAKAEEKKAEPMKPRKPLTRTKGINTKQTPAQSIRKAIPQVSAYHKETLKQYKPLRREFLNANKFCQLRLTECTHNAEVVHHTAGKATRALYLDVSLWLASCSNCNLEVERIGTEAYDKGLKRLHTNINY